MFHSWREWLDTSNMNDSKCPATLKHRYKETHGNRRTKIPPAHTISIQALYIQQVKTYLQAFET